MKKSTARPGGFRVNGQAWRPGGPPPQVLRIVAYLDRLADEELKTTGELAAALGSTLHCIKGNYTGRPELKAYRQVAPYGGGRKTLWGNKRTIARLRKEMGL